MLAVFIDELGGSFAEYIEQTSTILLKLTQYKANDSIRNSVSSSFPGLVKCAKEAGYASDYIIKMGQTYLDAIFKALKNETETDTMCVQV